MGQILGPNTICRHPQESTHLTIQLSIFNNTAYTLSIPERFPDHSLNSRWWPLDHFPVKFANILRERKRLSKLFWTQPTQSSTLGIGRDEGGKVSEEGEGGELAEVNQLQRAQQGVQPLCTEPKEKRWGKLFALSYNVQKSDAQIRRHCRICSHELPCKCTHEVPEWFSLNAHSLLHMLKEVGWSLRHHMLYPQPRLCGQDRKPHLLNEVLWLRNHTYLANTYTHLDILSESSHEADEKLCFADISWHSLCSCTQSRK